MVGISTIPPIIPPTFSPKNFLPTTFPTAAPTDCFPLGSTNRTGF
ncbi:MULTISPECIES: hypothetical protein [unclassified Apibacter]|nr:MULTISPECIES: hypothetical protein [unclassified Apibacter]